MWLCDRFVLSLADVDSKLLMEGENLMWVSHDAVFVLQHPGDPIPLRWAFVPSVSPLFATGYWQKDDMYCSSTVCIVNVTSLGLCRPVLLHLCIWINVLGYPRTMSLTCCSIQWHTVFGMAVVWSLVQLLFNFSKLYSGSNRTWHWPLRCILGLDSMVYIFLWQCYYLC